MRKPVPSPLRPRVVPAALDYPPFLESCRIWADPAVGCYSDTGTTLCTDGVTARQWNSSRGAITQATAGSRPTWRATALSGQPCLEFDGADELLLPDCGTLDRRAMTFGCHWRPGRFTGSHVLLHFNANAITFYWGSGPLAMNTYDGSAVRTFATTIDPRPAPQYLLWRASATEGRVWASGENSTYDQAGDAVAMASGTVSATPGNIGSDSGASLGSNCFGAGTLFGRFAVWSKRLADPEARQAMEWLRRGDYNPVVMDPVQTPCLVVGDGNSLMAGSGIIADSTTTTFNRMMTSLGSGYRGINVAFPTQQTPELITQFFDRVHRYYNPLRKNVLVIWEGTNHLKLGGVSAATASTSIRDYAALAKRNGWRVVVGTILPREDDATFYTNRATVNSTLNSSAAGDGYTVADVAANATIGDNGDEDNATNYLDKIHLTGTGAAVAAGIFVTAVQTAAA